MSLSIIKDINDFIILKSHFQLPNFYHIQNKLSTVVYLCKIIESKSHPILLKLVEEFEWLFQCSHSNIVGFYGICEKINPLNNYFQFFLLYEEMDYNLLDLVLLRKEKNSYFSSIEMKCFVSNIFEALSYLERAHARANNNLKPENILISKNGAIFKISDIGLRKMRTKRFPQKYIPPNIYNNTDFLYYSYDYMNYDIFNFGVLILEVATLNFLDEEANIYEDNELIKLDLLQETKERYGNLLGEFVEKCLGNKGLALLSFKECRKHFQEYMVDFLY